VSDAKLSETKLRRSAEEIFADELAALKAGDDRPRPENWLLSPAAVVTYLLGGTAKDGTVISAKYIGNRRLVSKFFQSFRRAVSNNESRRRAA